MDGGLHGLNIMPGRDNATLSNIVRVNRVGGSCIMQDFLQSSLLTTTEAPFSFASVERNGSSDNILLPHARHLFRQHKMCPVVVCFSLAAGRRYWPAGQRTTKKPTTNNDIKELRNVGHGLFYLNTHNT